MPTPVTTDAELSAAIAAAAKPVIVDFWATWCGPCRTMNPVFDQIEGFRFAEVVKVDIDKAPALAERFGVQSVPTMVLFRDGAESGRLIGAQPLESVVRGFSLAG